MTRWWTAFGFLAGLAACQFTASKSEPSPVNIAALDWLSADADPVAHLTQQPATCLARPDDPSVQRGALLFASPTLLGGQAAKADLSCAACHRNGRGNPDFVFAGISQRPGTADVTHGLFSSARADRVFNPVPIPDLATAAGRVLVDRAQEGALEAFLAAQIVEEFSGSAPDASVVSDLAAYIRTLDDAACDPRAIEPQSWKTELDLVRAGLTSDWQGMSAYADAMRAALGRIHNRFAMPEHAVLRANLITLSREIGAATAPERLAKELDRLAERLESAESESYYNDETLSRRLR